MPIVTRTPEELRARNAMKWRTHHEDVLPLWVAEMDVATCPAITEALRSAVEREAYGYPVKADHRLQEATASWCARRYQWEVDPGRVHVLPDVLTGVITAIDNFTVPHSPIVLPVPAYMPFFDVLDATGRRGIFVEMVPVTEDDGREGWRFDLEAIERAFAGGAGGLILCNPYNPLGAVFPAEHLREVCEIAARHGAKVISDEIHATLVYDRPHLPTATVGDVAAATTITITAASKGFNTPGLKCAQLILSNDADVTTWRKINRYRYEGASTFGIEAAIAGYDEGEAWLDELLVFLKANRDYLDGALPQALPGLTWTRPRATYLAWLDFRGVGALRGEDPSRWLLAQAKVFLNPGPAFGDVGGGFARLNFGTSREILEEFVSRVADAGSRA